MGNKKRRLDKTAVNDDHSSSMPTESCDTEMPDDKKNTHFIDSNKIKQECDIKQEPVCGGELVEIPASMYVAHVADSNGLQTDNNIDYFNLNEVKLLKTNVSGEEVPGDEQDGPPVQGGEWHEPGGRNDANNTIEPIEHGKQSKPHKCESCEYSTRHKPHLKQHLLKHTGEKPHGCSFCPKRFTSKQSLQTHMKTHVEELLFHCRCCLQGFNEKDTKTTHEASCMVLRYECHICKKSFGSYKANIIKHMRVHSGERPFECSECFKQFARKSGLKRHNKQHDGSRLFRCSKCHQRFSGEDERIIHEEKCNYQAYECDICGKSFGSYKFNWIRHMRTHTGEKPFQCKECSKKFTTKNSLKKHMKIHAKKLQFKCLICRQGFSKDDKRKVHQRSCNDRNYECHLCNKFFSSAKTLLVRHMRTHSGERPFQCQLCQVRFTEKGNLNKHMYRFHKINL